MPLTLKYNEGDFASTILDQSRRISEDVQDRFAFNSNPARQVWFHVPRTWICDDSDDQPWTVQVWRGDPLNADLLEEVADVGVRDICAAMEYLCSDISRGIRVIDGGSTLVAENIVEAVVKQNPDYLTPETCDAILQMVVYGAIPHK